MTLADIHTAFSFHLLRRYKADATITRMTPNGAISLLHICASRRRQSRPGRVIADALIAAGVPLESVDVRSRSPFAAAVLNHNFDVATALLESGANIHATYPFEVHSFGGPETKKVNVLVEILSQHTMRTLESLKFLFNQHRKRGTPRPAFLVDIDARFSILHLLAGSPQYTHIAQITPKILNLCLETYSESEYINYRHPILGTPLYYAATNGHKAMVERLLELGADATFSAGPDMSGTVQTLLRRKESWSPLWAAILRLDEALKKGILFPPTGPPGVWLGSNLIRNLEKTVDLLLEGNEDESARQAVEQLRQRKSSLNDEARAWKRELTNKRKETKAGKDERPIDLSMLGDMNSKDEKRIRDIGAGPEEEWRTEELGQFLNMLRL
jgi:ankyrin repeat protein